MLRRDREHGNNHTRQNSLALGVHYCSDGDLSTGVTCWNNRKGTTVMTPFEQSNWLHLAEQASKERDPEKLMSLVSELNRALEENERTSQRLQAREPI